MWFSLEKVVGSCEHGKKPTVPARGGKFPDSLRGYQLPFYKDSTLLELVALLVTYFCIKFAAI
jgi:hypothetical protein